MKMHTNPQEQRVWRTAVSGFRAREHETPHGFRKQDSFSKVSYVHVDIAGCFRRGFNRLIAA